ncbi:VOC family protein [Micromonospora rhizosphaerae]|uniref:VOC family protein n=1 Tax=Micromonospora rhizosphaerae TaxID=568872 RepID=UPI00159EF968|nr:VOC family protein [Micromonospora rhizosphaerae]
MIPYGVDASTTEESPRPTKAGTTAPQPDGDLSLARSGGTSTPRFGPRLLPRLNEGKPAKNPMHIDIRVAGPGPWDMAERAPLIRQKVPELVAAGATVVSEEWYGDVLGHVVMNDPEGNEFCVA